MTRLPGFSKARQLWITVLCLSCSWAFAYEEATVLSFSPSAEHIPSNTLRLYIQFSESMGRGQVSDHIALLNEQGEVVENPFLNLGWELWDSEQKVVTLLFDPGRIKRGVGPNTQSGSPLKVGETYQLLVKASMQSAMGAPMNEDKLIKYRVGPPMREPLNLLGWHIAPPSTSSAALTIHFDRLMDAMAVLRMIAIVSEDGELVRGRPTTNGSAWEFKPDKPWATGSYKVVTSAELEDISGNTMNAPFDAPAGTMRQSVDEKYLEFEFPPK